MAYSSVEVKKLPYAVLIDGVVRQLVLQRNDGTLLEVAVGGVLGEETYELAGGDETWGSFNDWLFNFIPPQGPQGPRGAVGPTSGSLQWQYEAGFDNEPGQGEGIIRFDNPLNVEEIGNVYLSAQLPDDVSAEVWLGKIATSDNFGYLHVVDSDDPTSFVILDITNVPVSTDPMRIEVTTIAFGNTFVDGAYLNVSFSPAGPNPVAYAEIVVGLSDNVDLDPLTFLSIPFDEVVSQIGSGLTLVDGKVVPADPNGVYVVRLDLNLTHGTTRDGTRYAYVDLDGDGAYVKGRFSGTLVPATPIGIVSGTEINVSIEGKPGDAFGAYAYAEVDEGVAIDSGSTYLKVTRIR